MLTSVPLSLLLVLFLHHPSSSLQKHNRIKVWDEDVHIASISIQSDVLDQVPLLDSPLRLPDEDEWGPGVEFPVNEAAVTCLSVGNTPCVTEALLHLSLPYPLFFFAPFFFFASQL